MTKRKRINHPKYRSRKMAQQNSLFEKKGGISYSLKKDGDEINLQVAAENIVHLQYLALEIASKAIQEWIEGYEERKNEASAAELEQIETSLLHFNISKEVLAFLSNQSKANILATFHQAKIITE